MRIFSFLTLWEYYEKGTIKKQETALEFKNTIFLKTES